MSQKLWPDDRYTYQVLTHDWGQAIDRNFYPYRAGIEVSDEGDSIKSSWRDEQFDELCDYLKKYRLDKITDVIFHLYDLSGEARTNIVSAIRHVKYVTKSDGLQHDVAILPDTKYDGSFGFTFISSNSTDLEKLKKDLFFLCEVRKYKCKSNFWMGMGSLKGSQLPFDVLIYNDLPWSYDEYMHRNTRDLKTPVQRVSSFVKQKVGRNDPCFCGSTKKFKHCCLRIS